MNEETRVLSSRRLFQIVQEMCALLRTDLVSSIGAKKGIGSFGYTEAASAVYGGDVFKLGWPFAPSPDQWKPVFETEEPPKVELEDDARDHAQMEPTEKRGLALSGLMRLSDAKEIIEWTRKTIWLDYLAQCAGKRKSYRRFAHTMRFRYRLALYATRAKDLAEKSIYRRNKVLRNRQRVSARQHVQRKRPIRPGTVFIYNGSYARRLPPGRIPLPDGEWMRRYRARRAKERKTNARRPNRKNKMTSAPALSSGFKRPRYMIIPHTGPDSHRTFQAGETVSTNVRSPDATELAALALPQFDWENVRA
jgi:hypothetical protein